MWSKKKSERFVNEKKKSDENIQCARASSQGD